MPHLSIRLQRGRDGPDVLTCTRPDGSRTWQRLQRGLPVHDLAHYAVESVLGLRNGFYGLVAQGLDITALEAPENRDKLTSEAIWEEFIVSLFMSELSDGIEREVDEFNTTLAAMVESGRLAECRTLTASELAAIRALMRDLVERWRSLTPSQSMDLTLRAIPSA